MFPRTICLSSLLSLLIMTQTPHFHALSHANRWTAGSTVISAIKRHFCPKCFQTPNAKYQNQKEHNWLTYLLTFVYMFLFVCLFVSDIKKKSFPFFLLFFCFLETIFSLRSHDQNVELTRVGPGLDRTDQFWVEYVSILTSNGNSNMAISSFVWSAMLDGKLAIPPCNTPVLFLRTPPPPPSKNKNKKPTKRYVSSCTNIAQHYLDPGVLT